MGEIEDNNDTAVDIFYRNNAKLFNMKKEAEYVKKANMAVADEVLRLKFKETEEQGSAE